MSDTPVQKKLKELIVPGTSPEVRAGYLTLYERSLNTDFGSLVSDVVSLDTETTGLSIKDCGLTEISAVKRGQDGDHDFFETYVNPLCPIPPEITALTGISNKDVIDAPSPRSAVRELAQFVAGAPIIAHNAAFDKGFIERVKGGVKVSSTWIDTLSLSRIALPCLSSHSLANLAEAFGVSSPTHRAADDALSLLQLWPVLLQGLLDLPAGVLETICDMHADIPWAPRRIFSELIKIKGPSKELFSLKNARAKLTGEDLFNPRKDADKIPEISRIDENALADEFLSEGTVARMYEQFEPRDEQTTMAKAVAHAFNTSTHLSVEAGCGVGKSVAYLLPAIRLAQKNNITVGVATKTNTLTDQLLSTELPALNETLTGGVSYVGLKGYDHYLCLHRLQRSIKGTITNETEALGVVRSQNTVMQDRLTALATALAFAVQSAEGDLDGLGIRRGSVPLSMISTSPKECLRNKCPFFPHACMVFGARRRAAAADVVVTNHALLLRDIALDGRLLPPIRHWIIDEAHSLEAEARTHWASELSEEYTDGLFEQISDKKDGLLRRLLTVSKTNDDADTNSELALSIEQAQQNVGFAHPAWSRFFGKAQELEKFEKTQTSNNRYDITKIWLGSALRSSDLWKDCRDIAQEACVYTNELVQTLESICVVLEEQKNKELADVREAIDALYEILSSADLVCNSNDPSLVYSAEILSRMQKKQAKSPTQAKKTVKLLAEKLDVGKDLASRWIEKCMSVVFTSATLSVAGDFLYFTKGIGLDCVETHEKNELLLSSSFDFDRLMTVVVVRGLPDPGSPEYLKALEDLLFCIHSALGGSVLTLFTARRDMERTFAGLSPRLKKLQLDLAFQERNFSPPALSKRFTQNKNLSLLALKSFWEGFDAAGDTLRCVVIPKLPFGSPAEPLSREREARDRSSWWKYSLPQAVLETKQAAGRLIRSATDTGVLVLADPRILTKRYGKTFVDSMPSKTVLELDVANVERYLRFWRASHR